MPAPLRIHLSAEEDQSLLELSTADGVPKRTKLRAIALRLNADGWNVPQIATHLKQSEHTIRATLERWRTKGVDGLWEMPGRGRKPRWTEADISIVEQWLAESRSYSSSQLSEKLAQERGVQLGARRESASAQKKGWCWKRWRQSPPPAKSADDQQAKLADWLLLKHWAESGLICLKYLDESGFERTSGLGYSYVRSGQQKQICQPRRRGRRISVLGLWQPQRSFEYGVVVGGFNTKRYLKLMKWQAKLAAEQLAQTGQITVIIQDGASFHKSRVVQQHWQRWQQQGLFIFFLPPYSPQMNRIEEEWLHLKRDELASRVFDDEYDVAMALIAGIEARGQRRGYPVVRFRFD